MRKGNEAELGIARSASTLRRPSMQIAAAISAEAFRRTQAAATSLERGEQ
jgi:hypothetical protein